MKTTIDRAGRIVVPKAVREELGLTPGQELDVTASDGRLQIEPIATPMHLERRDGRLVATADKQLPPLSRETVRATLERVRERR